MWILRPERNRAEWATGVRRSATGRPFQAVGPATEKAQRCRITVRERGTSNSACAEERNEIGRSIISGATLFPEIRWSQAFHATPNQRSDAVDNTLRVGEPAKDIPHIRRDPAKLRNAAHKTGCRSQDPV